MKTRWASGLGSGLLVRFKNLSMEKLFLLVFLFFGIIFVAIIPPGWNTDETSHTYRIYQLSEGNLLSEQVVTPRTGLKAYGGEVPAGLVRLYDKTGANEPGSVGNPNRKIERDLYKNKTDLLKLKKDGQRTSINFSGAALYSPVSYLIYLPVFWLGDLLSMPFFWIVMLSRVVGLILTGAAFFWAIKLIPVGKWILFATGLIPTVVAQAATVGADAPQMALCVLFIALVARLLFTSKKPGWLHYGTFAILGAALVLIKFAYAPILLLLLAVPFIKRGFRDRRNILLSLLVIVIAIVPGLIWAQLVSYIDINSNPQANFAAQKAFILNEPLTYLNTLYHTFFTNTPMPPLNNILGSFIWDSAYLPAIYAYLGSAAVVLSLFVKSLREKSSTLIPKQNYRLWRGSLIVTSFATVILIATALYVYSTPLRQSYIFSIQSRYFIPLLPMILLVFYGNFAKNHRVVKGSIVVLNCIALLGAVLTIYARLYQTLT